MEPTLRVNAPSVVGEIIDGEAVIMDLALGHYFSSQGSGAEIWAGIEAGLGRTDIVDWLAARYASDRTDLTDAVDVFVSELLDRRLVVEDAALPGAVVVPPAAPRGDAAARQIFVAPALNTYADMEDLLLLDPIHDVDAVGWPVARTPDKNAPRSRA